MHAFLSTGAKLSSSSKETKWLFVVCIYIYFLLFSVTSLIRVILRWLDYPKRSFSTIRVHQTHHSPFFFLAPSRGLQNPSSPTRNWTQATTVKVLSSNHWTSREFPSLTFQEMFLSEILPKRLTISLCKYI